MRHIIALVLLLSFNLQASDEPNIRTLNSGNLVLHDIPEIPQSIKDDLNQYQNVRSAPFRTWRRDGQSLYISTRFGDISQLHRVNKPGGARHQVTFNSEPIGRVSREPDSNRLFYTMDAGGSEFSQIFLLDTSTSRATMLTDGQSRNSQVSWTRNGGSIAYTSTARNGRSNDIWRMEVDEPESASLLLESPDGTLWLAADFTSDDQKVLTLNYRSITDSRIHLLDPASGKLTLLAGDGSSTNYAGGFDASDEGFFFLTDQGSEFTQLAWAPLDEPTAFKRISSNIDWNVESFSMSEDRKRAAFTVNAGGIYTLYLMDPKTHRYSQVDGLPTGYIGGLSFSPDGRSLALTLNTPQTPSDTFVLSLGRTSLSHGEVTRWTYSEVGGLDTGRFIEPTLIEYKSFDDREIPAFLYKPEGEGPFPVVISIHGGPESQAVPTFSSTYQMWIEKLGVAVLVPNVRGSDGYGKSYLKLDNGYLREDSVKDIGALLDWITTQPTLNDDRVAVFGGSYGGYMVLASAVHYSERLRAAVNIVGISNFVTFLENTEDYRRDLRRVEYGDERDPEMREFLNRISPLNNVDKIKVPLFVVQGQNDPRVPVTEADQIVKALQDQQQPVWYMNALNEGHGYRRKENRDIYREATVMFLDTFLVN